MMIKTIIFGVLAVAVLNDAYKMSTWTQSDPTLSPSWPPSYIAAMCRRNGAEDKIKQAEAASETFYGCLNDLIYMPILQTEIAGANGNFNQVFKKYCAKSPQFKTCLHKMFDDVSPCIDPEERKHSIDDKKSSEQLLDFVCYNDGERLSQFYAEGGPQCLQSKQGDLEACLINIANSFKNVEHMMSLSISQRCKVNNEFLTCIEQKLKTCHTPIADNMFKSLVDYTFKGTACESTQSEVPTDANSLEEAQQGHSPSQTVEAPVSQEARECRNLEENNETKAIKEELLELEKSRVQSESKIADAIVTMAEASKKIADASIMNAETSRKQLEVLSNVMEIVSQLSSALMARDSH